MSLIEFDCLRKTLRGRRIINDLSLQVPSGILFGLIGRSGSGKTTLFKIFLGMMNADSGDIYLDNKSLISNKKYLRKNVGFASQENMLYDELTLYENIKYFGKLYGVRRGEIRQRAEDLLNLFELGHARNLLVKNLSGGMMKRANILISMIHNPKVLVLDEPTVGLDPLLRDKIWEYIHKVNNLGTTILISSHLFDELELNCSFIGIMTDGKISKIVDARDKGTFTEKSLRKMLEAELQNG